MYADRNAPERGARAKLCLAGSPPEQTVVNTMSPSEFSSHEEAEGKGKTQI